jgi:hypothetical protein
VPKTRFEFRRGFLEKMISPLANATRHADRIIAEAPLVRDLELSIHGQTDRVELARPTSAALLSRASALTILGRHRGETRGGLGPRGRFEGLARVAFPRLRSLALRTLRVTSPDIASFLARQRALESLSLTLNLDAEALAVPLREHGFPELRRLLLARNTVGRICSRLIDAGLDERLVELDLSFTGMFDEDLRALLRKPWSMLRRLGIAYNALTRASLDHLAAWDGAPELEELDLRRLVNGVGVELILQRKWPKARILI